MMMNHILRSNHFMKLHSLLAMLVLFLSLVGCNPKEEDNNFSITSLSETFGSPNGGTEITITGNNFSLVDGITFDGVACTDVTIVSKTQITCTIPAHGAGLVTVKIFGRANRVATATYTYGVIPLTITSFLPLSGDEAGLINIDIVGTGFLAGATVTIGGVNCPSVVVSSSSLLSCTVPAHAAGFATIVVTNPDLITASSLPPGYKYKVAPVITSLSPTFAMLAGGGVLTITGTGFLAGNTVKVGGTNCPVLTEALTSITCTIPSKTAWVYSVAVTNDNSLVGTLPSAFTYRGPPTVTSVGPNHSTLAGLVTISVIGTGFYTGTTVKVGGVNCPVISVASGTLLTCTNPANAVAGAYAVAVTNADTQTASLAAGFNYYAAPAVTTVSPIAGPEAGGGTLTLTGTGFRTGASITVGGTACTSVSVSSLTSATCILPAKTASVTAYTVTLTNTDFQTGSKPTAYTYRSPPTVTSVAFNAGALGGLTNVTVTGTGFLAGATVDFGGSNCGAPFTVVNGTTITCRTTAHAVGAVTVTVTNADLQSGFVATAYTYQAAPTVTLVTASSGLQVGGLAVTITGTGFLALPTLPTVTFDGTACTSIAVVSATSITCTTPALAGGTPVDLAVDVVVCNADSQCGTGVGAFTYTATPILAFFPVSALHDYGTLTLNQTYTFTIKNVGEGTAAPILAVAVPNASGHGAYSIPVDNCSGNTLIVGGTCTFDLTFNAAALIAFPRASGTYPDSLNVTSPTGGTASISITGGI